MVYDLRGVQHVLPLIVKLSHNYFCHEGLTFDRNLNLFGNVTSEVKHYLVFFFLTSPQVPVHLNVFV